MSGLDFSDLVMKHNVTREDWIAAVEAVRSESNAEPLDEILAKIEQMFLVADDIALDHLEDMLSDEDIAALDPPSFIVDRWFPRGFYSCVYGAPGVMKTFNLLDVSRRVRAGGSWHSNSVEQGSTLFYQGEGLQQLQDRIAAWSEFYPGEELTDGRSLARFVDMTTPTGVAAVIRTVLGFQQQTGQRVVMVLFDPAVEFMTGDENGDGMDQLTRGLRSLAQYLDIAVVVGHHTNAAEGRSRGADFMRMRAGAHIRMEALEDGLVGIVQEKQKNTEKLALVLEPTPVGKSLVLQALEHHNAVSYSGRKARSGQAQKAAISLDFSAAKAEQKFTRADELLSSAIRSTPGLGRAKVLASCKSQGVGAELLETALDRLIGSGVVRVEKTGEAKNSPQKHYLNEMESPA
ncbi:AAA family ATPase [Glaciihabitans sp. UYNi722]|uniref:AAA family ATPase n=1 Tax=Glaciihabitans sp. UYNi722 TaxID=3156344 RepID=UPI00339B63CF